MLPMSRIIPGEPKEREKRAPLQQQLTKEPCTRPECVANQKRIQELRDGNEMLKEQVRGGGGETAGAKRQQKHYTAFLTSPCITNNLGLATSLFFPSSPLAHGSSRMLRLRLGRI